MCSSAASSSEIVAAGICKTVRLAGVVRSMTRLAAHFETENAAPGMAAASDTSSASEAAGSSEGSTRRKVTG